VSGLVGMVRMDGAPVDHGLLEQMTSFLSFRGPDAQGVWKDGPAGLGHAMLRMALESLKERQPCTLDGQVWIAADARLDDRSSLIERLAAEGRRCFRDDPDAVLLLHAYHAWGEQCVEHLLGDFAFAIWDAPRQRLFCARDPFGVKPFFYARAGNCFVFSNTLDCIRIHPAVTDKLNDLAIADFLLFDFNQDLSTTSFADIQRLPPAHALTLSSGVARLHRYWTLPVETPLRYKQEREYVEHYRELLRRAVEDRLRTESVGVLMSGGLDSASVSATAKQAGTSPPRVRAYTIVLDKLIPDEERHYAGQVAQALGIPIEYLAADNYELYERWREPEMRTPEPLHDPLFAIMLDQLLQVAVHHRVVLTGEGGDPSLSTSVSSYARQLIRARQLGRFFKDFARYWWAEGRLSRLYLRTRLRVLRERSRRRPFDFPWLNEEFTLGLDLRSRWAEINHQPAPDHPLRPTAYQALLSPLWPFLFEVYEPGVTRLLIEVRYPLFDLRLVRYLLRIPPVPWCTDKEIVRVAMQGVLPEPVRLRRKTPMRADPLPAILRRGGGQWRDRLAPAPELAKYVDWRRIPRVTGHEDSAQAWNHLRPISLNFWLQFMSSREPFLVRSACVGADPRVRP